MSSSRHESSLDDFALEQAASASATRKRQAKRSIRRRINAAIEEYPRIWKALKWLILGALTATVLYFSGGLAAIPYVAQMAAGAIPAITPLLAAVQAALWTYVLKPIGARFLKFFGWSRPAASASLLVEVQVDLEASLVSPTHRRVLNELEKEASERLEHSEEKACENASEADWYSAEQLERQIYAEQGETPTSLKYVFMAQDYNGDPSFEKQFGLLRALKNAVQAPYASFISTEPSLSTEMPNDQTGASSSNAAASFNTSHFIMGIVINRSLFIINPLGETKHKGFYKQLAELNKKHKFDEIILSRTPLQRDAKALISCGPLCLELMRHFSSLTGQAVTERLAAAKKASGVNREFVEYQTIDLGPAGFLPSSLQGLEGATKAEYNQRMVALRSAHQKMESPAESDPQLILMNQLVQGDEMLSSLPRNENFKSLRRCFAKGGSSFGPNGSSQFAPVPASQLMTGTVPGSMNSHKNTGPQ